MHSKYQCVTSLMTRLYFRTLFILVLSPLPPGGPEEDRIIMLLKKSKVFCRFRPGSEGIFLSCNLALNGTRVLGTPRSRILWTGTCPRPGLGYTLWVASMCSTVGEFRLSGLQQDEQGPKGLRTGAHAGKLCVGPTTGGRVWYRRPSSCRPDAGGSTAA